MFLQKMVGLLIGITFILYGLLCLIAIFYPPAGDWIMKTMALLGAKKEKYNPKTMRLSLAILGSLAVTMGAVFISISNHLH